jgi:Spy/CpxP family protein refolding chaperone
MRTRFLAIAVGLAVSGWAIPTLAQPPFHGGPPPMMDSGAGRVLGLMLHTDDLSDAQQQQVDAIMSSDRTAVHDTLDQLKAANESLASALLADAAPTADSLASLTDQIGTLRSALASQQLQTALAVRALLTPEQVAAAAARRESMAASWDRGRMGEHP